MLNFIFALPFVGPFMAALTALFQGAGPLLRGASEALVEFLGILWEGAKDMLDNWKSIAFVLCVGVAAGYYGHVDAVKSPKTCKAAIEQLHKDYTFIPKKNTKKTSTGWKITPWSL